MTDILYAGLGHGKILLKNFNTFKNPINQFSELFYEIAQPSHLIYSGIYCIHYKQKSALLYLIEGHTVAVEKENKEKKSQLTRFEPMSTQSQGVHSTAVLKPLPNKKIDKQKD